MKGLCDHHRLKWGSIPPNEVGRIAQHVRKGEGRKERDGVSIVYDRSVYYHLWKIPYLVRLYDNFSFITSIFNPCLYDILMSCFR